MKNYQNLKMNAIPKGITVHSHSLLKIISVMHIEETAGSLEKIRLPQYWQQYLFVAAITGQSYR